MNKIIYLIAFQCFTNLIFAQKQNIEASRIKNEIILQLAPSTNVNDLISALNKNQRSEMFSLSRTIDAEYGYYLLKLNEEQALENTDEMLYAVRSKTGVLEANFNYRAEYRGTLATPNDTFFNKQWNMSRIKAELVWDSTTGGKTACGDEIVVGIGEPGFGYNRKHEDIIANLFVNKVEIANDGKDNDGNGYVDDINGIDAQRFDGKIAEDPQRHGTSVLGIIGAKGNNKIGVTGVNWNVKMLLVSAMSTEADAVAGYLYMVKMRKLYNESNGKKGAFIVVTNYSGGIDLANAANFPMWCSMFEKLGEVGILSVGAGPDRNVDVDKVGDIPTTCASEYLIAVTNSNKSDALNPNSGFGVVNMDLAAPGGTYSSNLAQITGSFTVKSDAVATNKYEEFTGTSASAPHVAGAIALLYSIPDSALCKAAKANPSKTALFMKSILLENVDKLTAFATNTVSGGRLNVSKAFNALKVTSAPTQAEDLNLYPNPAKKKLYFSTKTLTTQKTVFEIYNMLGELILTTSESPIDVSNFAVGAYHLVSRTSDGKKLVAKRFLVN